MHLSYPYTRLDPNLSIPSFDCGDDDLNEFFHIDASLWQKELMAVTYYLDIDNTVILYFSLSNDKISAEKFSKAAWRKFRKEIPYDKHRSDYPAVKIGRFAVNKNFQRTPQHWGRNTIEFIKKWMIDNNKTGCRYLTVDAYPDAVSFYISCNFKFLGREEEERYLQFTKEGKKDFTVALYFNLKEIDI